MPDKPDQPTGRQAAAIAAIIAAVAESDLEHRREGDRQFVITLPGDKRLATSCWLTVGEHSLAIEAFVLRRPDERIGEVHRWLLSHNPRMYALAWSIDDAGDVYLTGRIPLAGIDSDEVDRLLGAVLNYADSAFNTLLELGFGSSIRREWAWRESRGESLANLAAFAGFVQREQAGSDPSSLAQ